MCGSRHILPDAAAFTEGPVKSVSARRRTTACTWAYSRRPADDRLPLLVANDLPTTPKRHAPSAVPGGRATRKFRTTACSRAPMILPGETEAVPAGKQPGRGITWWAYRDDERSAEVSLLRSSKNHTPAYCTVMLTGELADPFTVTTTGWTPTGTEAGTTKFTCTTPSWPGASAAV